MTLLYFIWQGNQRLYRYRKSTPKCLVDDVSVSYASLAVKLRGTIGGERFATERRRLIVSAAVKVDTVVS